MAQSLKTITLAELKQHKDKNSGLWVAVHNRVFDVTKFITEHPGGEDILKEHAGGFATKAFDDVGHSNDAKTLMRKYLIGEIAEADKEPEKASKDGKKGGKDKDCLVM